MGTHPETLHRAAPKTARVDRGETLSLPNRKLRSSLTSCKHAFSIKIVPGMRDSADSTSSLMESLQVVAHGAAAEVINYKTLAMTSIL